MGPSFPTLCPRCGTSLDNSCVDGLCVRCLGALNFATDSMFPGVSTAQAPPPTADELAPHFPQLEIIECLGRGGMGVVYKARQKLLNRFVALKLLAPERANDPQFAGCFEREAQALAALNHPHIVGVHDFGQAGGFYYLIMEFVDGVNLRQAMRAGRFTPEQALAIVPPVCEALQYAHEHGIVHRDVKPENLLLDKEGRVKIADFGIAKILGAEASGVGLPESQPAGTPQYMAPEQKEHRATDHRADIYSLGVVLYEMLTGELPADKLQPPSRRVQVDVRIDEIVLRALEVKPEMRFQTAADFRTRVENVKSGKAVAQIAAPPGLRFRLVEERDGRRVFVWRGVLAAVFAVCAIALIVGAASLLVASGSPPPLIIAAFAGIAALLTVVTFVRISFKSSASPHSEPDNTTGPPRFSRAAIMGACWMPTAIVAAVAAYLMVGVSRHGSVGPVWWLWALLAPLLILGVTGPFGTTILGWVAVAQIRRSAGRIHGLQLALFDGLLFPLMTLSAVIALASVAMAKMFVDFYANPSVVGHPHTALVTRMANWLSLNKEVAVIVGVFAAIVVNVLIVRTVLRAVRKEVSSAPPDTSVTGNEIKVASIAIIFALIATALGALAAIRSGGAWPAMALSLLFAGMSIIMALPVRRLGVGKCALIIAVLGAVIWPLAAFGVRQTSIVESADVSGIEKVEVTEDEAMINQPRYDLEGMIVTFGSAGERWTPAGVYLEAMFDATLEPHSIGGGANWVMKPRHGIHWGYRLDGPPGPMLGKIVFHPGTPTPEADGAYVIGEFRPDKGEPLPIAVRLEKDSAKTVAPPQASSSGSVLQPEAKEGATTVQPATDDSISLAQAVNDFNKRYHEETVTTKQPELTVEDVLGAIRQAMQDRANLSVTNATFAALGRLAETQVLPMDFELELLTNYEDDQTTRHVWSVRLRIPGTVIPNGTTCISIHEKLLSTHIIGEEERKVIHAWQEKERARGGIGTFERVEWGRKLREERDAAAAIDARKKSAAIPVGEPTGAVGIALNAKDGTFYVGDVVPESPAAMNQGIQKNDTILAVAEGDQPAVPVSGKPMAEVVNMLSGKVGTPVRLTVLPADAKDGKAREIILTRVNLAALLGRQAIVDDATLRSLSWHQFDQTPGQYWRALSDAGRFAEAADLIERMLALHPELDLDWEAINGANLHFHAAQCRAFAGDKDVALKHIVAARHRQSTPGDYLDGTAAFLSGDKASLQAARDKLAAGHDINQPNTAVLDRLIANFGKPYREAYTGQSKAAVPVPVAPIIEAEIRFIEMPDDAPLDLAKFDPPPSGTSPAWTCSPRRRSSHLADKNV